MAGGRHGVCGALIGLEEGCRLLEQELLQGRKGEAEVVIGGATGPAGANGATAVLEPAGLPLIDGAIEIDAVSSGAAPGTHALYTFDLERDRYLGDHRIDGRPVLPFAAAMELMAEAAVAGAPQRTVAGLQEIRLLDGVALEHERPARVRIDAATRAGGEEVEVTIAPPDGGRMHYRALVELRDAAVPNTPRFARGWPGGASHEAPAPLADPRPFPIEIEDAYRELLFHGPLFRGIVAIDAIDERGASALLAPSRPGACVAGADGMRWLLDPVLLDSALQVQVLWARLQWDVTLLPAEIGGYTLVGAVPEAAPARHELRISPASNAPLCQADHWFYGPDGRLVSMLRGVVGVGTRTLNRLAGAHP